MNHHKKRIAEIGGIQTQKGNVKAGVSVRVDGHRPKRKEK